MIFFIVFMEIERAEASSPKRKRRVWKEEFIFVSYFPYNYTAIISGNLVETMDFTQTIYRSLDKGTKKSIAIPKPLKEEFAEELSVPIISQERDYRLEYMSRARRKIERLAYCNFNNRYTSLMTLTYKANEQELSKAYADLELFIKRLKYPLEKYQYPFPEFQLKYICKPEFQERGAVHFHLVTNLKSFPFAKKIVKQWKAQGNLRKDWDDEYNLQDIWSGLQIKKGTADLQPVAWEGMPNVVSYITGYMTKDFDDERFSGKKSYSTTRNLNKPRQIFNDDARLFIENLLKDREVKEKSSWEFTPESHTEQTISCCKYIVA